MVVGRVLQEGGRMDRTELTEADQREKARYEGPLNETASGAVRCMFRAKLRRLPNYNGHDG